MNHSKQVVLLIDIILDKKGDEAERQDALFYLRDYDDREIEPALLSIIKDENDDYNMRRDACETLAEVWNNQNQCNPNALKGLDIFYANDITMFTLALRPEWGKFFKSMQA